MELFSYGAFPHTCPHPTRCAVHPFNWVPLHNPLVFVLVQSLSLSSLSEWFDLKSSLAQWLLFSKTSSQSFPAGPCCPKGKAIKHSLAGLASPFTWAGLVSLYCSAGFPGCWNLLPALLPGWTGSLVCGNGIQPFVHVQRPPNSSTAPEDKVDQDTVDTAWKGDLVEPGQLWGDRVWPWGHWATKTSLHLNSTGQSAPVLP